jgi:hypothetical protein
MRKLVIFLFYTTMIEFLHLLTVIYWVSRKKIAIYGTNDDALISSISSGKLTGFPDPHLIFIQPLISYPIIWLESLLTNFSGYTIFLLFSTTISFTLVLVNRIINKNYNLIFYLSWLFVNIIFHSWFAINPTYTGASLFTSGAAAALTILLLKNKFNGNYPLVFSIAFLFTLSYMIRIEGVYIYFLIIIPFIFLYLKNLILIKRKIGIIIILVSIPLISNMGLSLKLYENDAWKEYTEMNNLRHKIQLREPERQMDQFLSEINWDEPTEYMFKRLVLVDPNFMNSTSMEKIIAQTNDYVGIKSVLKAEPTASIKNAIDSLKPWTWILQTLIFIIFLNLYIRINNLSLLTKYILEVSILTSSIFVLLYTLASGFHLPERITLNLLAAYSLVLVCLSPDKFYVNKKTFINLIVLLVSAVMVFKQFERFIIELNAREDFYKTRQAFALQQKQSFNQLDSEVVISSASSLKFDWIYPYNKYESFDDRNLTFILGWHNLSPAWNTAASNLGLDPKNIYASLVDNEALWVDSEDNVEPVLQFLEINQNVNLQFNVIGEVGNQEYLFYKFKSID